jgi:hypothetical protein
LSFFAAEKFNTVNPQQFALAVSRAVVQLWAVRRRYGMQKSGFTLLSRAASYFLGVALLLFGIVGLGIEIEQAQPSSSNINGYALNIMCIVCGALICIATRLQYGGGLWFVFGVILVSIAIIVTHGLLEVFMRGKHLLAPATSYSRIGTVWIVGVFCLVMGHMRHRKKRQSQLNTVVEQTNRAFSTSTNK